MQQYKNYIMKKLLLLASVSLLVITSCKKDDDEETVSITGMWKLNKTELKLGNGSTNTVTPNSCEAQTSFNFSNDGKVTSKVYEKVGTSCLSDTYSGTYSYDAGKKLLTLTEDGDTEVFEVSSLTASEFVILSNAHDYDGDGKTDKSYLHFMR